MEQTTQQPEQPKPTPEQVKAAVQTLGLAVAWREYEAEPGRTFEDCSEVESYRDSLYDLVTETNASQGEVVQAALDALGIHD